MSRYAGEFEHVFEASTAGVTLQAPQLDINTVAAGGGSRLFFRSAPHLGQDPLPCLPTRLQFQLSLPQGPACLWWGRSLQEPTLAPPATVKVRSGVPLQDPPLLPRPTHLFSPQPHIVHTSQGAP